MQTIRKQFVTYEIALAMKELGFDENCIAAFYNDKYHDLISCCYDSMEGDFIVENNNDEFHLRAPLWQQCIDWIETKGYYINITRVFQWNPLPIKFLGWCIHIGAENPEEQLECNSYYVRHYYPTKQEAHEQAILKCIELCKSK